MRGWQGRWVEAEREYKIKIKFEHAAQCPRTDFKKRFLPRSKTITA